MLNRRILGFLCIAVVAMLFGTAALGQQTAPTTGATSESAVNQALTYIDSAATYLGEGVLYVLNLITNDRVSPDLKKPIGYLAFITLILLLFGLLEFARRIIWIGIVVGWALLIVRIILDALRL